MSSWRRNRALFDSLRTEKRSLRSLRYRNGIPHISGESLSRVTQGKQRNAIVVTQTIPLARIVLSIGNTYSWNKCISPSITRNASIAGILFDLKRVQVFELLGDGGTPIQPRFRRQV